ncbi:MAG: hypothetical protein LBH01_04890 [Verrucomicrobiales bacterium]|jgi:preprotein translocase subunit SecD|nr:hypothetical protein [Verrucomicrobiales bacterium]
MKSLCLIAISVLLSLAVHAAENVFAICKVSETEQPSMVRMTVESIAENPDNGKAFFVFTDKVLDEGDIAYATTAQGNYYYRVVLQLTDAGKAKFAKFTRESLGQRMGVLLNGKLFSVPVVRLEVTDGIIKSAPYLSKQDAEGIVAGLRKGQVK